MGIINDFLRSLSTETRDTIWYGAIVCFFGTMAVASALYRKKVGASSREAIQVSGLTVISFCAMLSLAYGIEALTNRFLFLSGVTYCIPVVLFCAFVLSRRLKCKAMELTDSVFLAYMIGRVVHITGCSFVGCCQGLPIEWGIYSAVSKTTVVPVQAIESVCLLAMWLLLNRYYKRHGYQTNGKVFAVGLVAFGIINFVTDMFTVTFQKVIFVCSVEGIFAFLTMLAGLILLYIIDNKKPQGDSVTAETCNN